jgi:hypothetical protein
VKRLRLNSAAPYGPNIEIAEGKPFTADKIAAIRAEDMALRGDRSDAAYGCINKKDKVA